MVIQIDEKFDFTPETPQHLDHNRSGNKLRSRQSGAYRADDVIASLANAYENRRARQVTEWEKLPRHSFPAPV